MFDLSLYQHFLWFAKEKINSPYFNEYDIVHDLFEKDSVFNLIEGRKCIIGLIKKQGSHGVNFILTHQIYDDTYVCSKCKEPKPVAAFRLRNETRETYFDYVNDCCIECERKIKREWDKANKDTVQYKVKNQTRAKTYHWGNRDKILIQQKERRSTDEYKQRRREYNAVNRNKIREQAKAARITRLLKTA